MRLSFATLPEPIRGALWYLPAAASWAILGGVVRYLSSDLSALEIAFFRALYGLLILLPWIVRGGKRLLPRRRHGVYTVRGLCEAAALLCWFSSVALIPVADAIALTFVAPLLATILATLILGETVRLRRWTAIAIGMAGTLVIVRPGFQDLNAGILLALAAALALAGSRVAGRLLARTEPTTTIVGSILLFTLPCTLVPTVLVWQTPDALQLLLMLVIGGLATFAHFCLTMALRIAETSELAPYDFAQLPVAVVFGVIVFGEVPDLWTWIGGAVIAATSVYVVRREAQLRALSKASG
ncbi:MAG: DMT family transporter [Alphaproteobacteria bacterium]|nr:DMT family transporter [Alphaproteobacteria bacterium]